ncbi:MAG TPA: carboxypeptidase regulatory-like domain-containing protein [Blastocatellia bacterium]|nr:carboxypeptidase regulatory-like domain-containing protein [Blastocatellia bacterium]
MKLQFLRRSIVLLLALFTCYLAALAQTSRGTVSGIVSDQTGAVIANATVTLTNNDTGVSRSTVTNSEGLYRFDAVDLGIYTVKINASGFALLSKNNVSVSANQIATVDAQLAPGTQEIAVDITAETGASLQTEAPVRGGNINSVQITELPIATRNPVSLALTLPGVSTNRYGAGVQTFSVNGSRGRSNNFLIDGTENNDISVAGQGFQIKNPDSVQEVAVQTSNYDAEFGRAGGAVVNTITKSGTNQYHGTLGYLIESTRFNAISNTESLVAEVKRRGRPLPGTDQWFSGTFGGPIKKDRTFFFGSYQEERQNASQTANVITLSAAGRATLRSLFPEGRNKNVDTYLTITNGSDATANLSKVALGNGRPDIEFGTLVYPYAQTFLQRQWMAKIDHKISEKSQLSGRFLYDDTNNPTGGATVGFPGFNTSQQNKFRNFLVSETHIFTPTITNEARLAYNRIDLGFPLDPANQLGLTLPSYDLGTGLTPGTTNVGIQTNIPQGRVANNYLLQDTLTHVRGNHTFRLGTEQVVQRSRQFAPIVERGLLVYRSGGGFTEFANFVDDFGGSGPSTGSARRDFGSPAYYPELYRHAYFGQDRWRMNDALTLTLGVRYENFGTPINSVTTPAFTGLFNIDPTTFDGPYRLPNKVKADNNNFAPTLGIAWSPSFQSGVLGALLGDKRSVIRTGYQMGYDSFFNNIASNAATSSPNVVATSVVSTVSTANPRGIANLSTLLPATPRPLSPLDAQTLVDPNLVNPYFQRWSLGVQRELPGNWLIDMSYVGSKGTKLFLQEDYNPPVPAALRRTPTTTTPIPANRLSGRLDNLQGQRNIRTNAGSSSYHSGQLNVTRRFAQGFAVTGAYTWSKLIDNGSDVFGIAGTNAQSMAAVPSIFGGLPAERAVSMFDRTHRASITYVYDLPFMREQRGVVGRIVGGWQWSGVLTFETGVPLNVTNGQDADSIGGNLDRPDYNPNGRKNVRAIPNATSPTGYVNPDNNNAPIDRSEAMFIGIAANSGRTGNLGRNFLRTPGINNWDMNLAKKIAVTERINLNFRAEFFNVLNHPQFGIPSASAFAPVQAGISANVFTSLPGQFLKKEVPDGGARIIRFNLKLAF